MSENSDKAKPLYSRLTSVLVGLIVGMAALISCSFIQKLIAGYDAFLFKGYLIPALFGGAAGCLIGFYIHTIRQLNTALAKRVGELERILPICAHCKRIRKPDSDPEVQHSWQQIESYISRKTDSQFTHSICPECMEHLYRNEL